MHLAGPRRRHLSRRVAIATVAVAAMAAPAAVAATGPGKGSAALAGDQTPLNRPSSAPVVAPVPLVTSARQVNTASAESTTANPEAAGVPAAGKALIGDAAIPATVLAAYREAAATLAVQKTSCHLAWPLLAGIGKVETDHGRTWGAAARLTASGDVVPTILGPILDGTHGTGKLLDTDGGTLDHNRVYDRAVGPMQFVPSTWREFGRDGNGDGKVDPNNIWDAALGAANYLCAGGRNLAVTSDRRAAILAYNPSSSYVRSVLAWAAAYQRAAASGPALGSVPDPLVLGAGGQSGDDPFGDSSSYEDAGAAPVDPGSLSAIFGSGPPTGGGAIVVQSAPPTVTKPAVKPSTKPKPAVKATPACIDPGILAVAKTAITATAVDLDHDGKNDVLRVGATVTVAKTGKYAFSLRLRDAADNGITTALHTVTLKAGKQTFSEDLAGQAIGDAGVSGPATLRLAVRRADAATTCAVVLFSKAAAGTIDASTYDGWTVELARLQKRLADDIKAGLVKGDAVKTLTDALKTPTLISSIYRTFLTDLKTAKTVAPVEQIRLASLAQRLIDQAAATPSPSPTPSASVSPSASPTSSLSPSASPSATPSPTPSASVTPTPTP
jgi:membrane-bound lytic murein transglycosylase B